MVWDQRPPVLVMLTRLMEKGKVKIHFSSIHMPMSIKSICCYRIIIKNYRGKSDSLCIIAW